MPFLSSAAVSTHLFCISPEHLASARKNSAVQAVSEERPFREVEAQMTFRTALACEMDGDERLWEPYKSVFSGADRSGGGSQNEDWDVYHERGRIRTTKPPRSVSRAASAVILAPAKSGLMEGRGSENFAALDGVVSSRVCNFAGKVCCQRKPQDTTALAAMQAQLCAESIEHLLEAEKYLHLHQRTKTIENDRTVEQRVERFQHLTTAVVKKDQEAQVQKALLRNNLSGGWIQAGKSRQRYAPIDVATRYGFSPVWRA